MNEVKAAKQDTKQDSGKTESTGKTTTESKQKTEKTKGTATKSKPKSKVASGDWERTAYYSSEQQVADNIVFLGNYGGEGSGVFDK